IEVGKRADLIVCRLDRPQTTPVHDVVATLLFQAYGSEVETVLVDGQLLLHEGRLTRADEAEICRDAQRRSRDIMRRGGLRATPDAPGPARGCHGVPSEPRVTDSVA